MDFSNILDGFFHGKVKKEKVLDLIEQLKRSGLSLKNKVEQKVDSVTETTKTEKSTSDSTANSNSDSHNFFKGAFDKLRHSTPVDDLLKFSSGVIHQISEGIPQVPGQIEKLQNSIHQGLSDIHFSSESAGIQSKLSAFRATKIQEDSVISSNQVVGSHWFDVTFANKAVFEKNTLKGVHFSEVSVKQSNFNANTLSLARLSNVSLLESRLENSSFSFSNVSDFSISESDFIGCAVKKTEISQTVISESRLANLQFEFSALRECEFLGCDIQGITFENCKFVECTFEAVEVITQEPQVIKGYEVKGKTFKNIKSFNDFLVALDHSDHPHDDVSACQTNSDQKPIPEPEIVAKSEVTPRPKVAFGAIKKSSAGTGGLEPKIDMSSANSQTEKTMTSAVSTSANQTDLKEESPEAAAKTQKSGATVQSEVQKPVRKPKMPKQDVVSGPN